MHTFKKQISKNFCRANREILESFTCELVNPRVGYVSNFAWQPADTWEGFTCLVRELVSLRMREGSHVSSRDPIFSWTWMQGKICTLIPRTTILRMASPWASTLQLGPYFDNNCCGVLATWLWWPVARLAIELWFLPPHAFCHITITITWINCIRSKGQQLMKDPFKCFLIWPFSSSFDSEERIETWD